MPLEQQAFKGHIYVMEHCFNYFSEGNDIALRLSELKEGDSGVIIKNMFEGDMKRRLTDMGFSNQSEIACVIRSIFGDPCAYLIKGSVFALRKADADKIILRD